MLLRKSDLICKEIVSLFALCALASAAPPDRITGPVDLRQIAPIPGSVHRLAQPQFDRGAVDPAFPMNHLVLFVKPSAAQQAELDRLLADQQNPSSKQFRQWLSPEEFGNRFGLTSRDHSQVVAWLHSEGFTIDETARGRNWIMFSGTAAQVQQALHTAIHRYEVNGEKHFANTDDPAVPAALAGLVGGFEGLHDFQPRPSPKTVTPDYNSGGTHYLVPGDYATIYDIDPLYSAGIDGTGVNIGIIGFTTLLLGDIQAFRSKYGLPPNDPKPVLAGTSPGLNTGALGEADLDIEWSGAVAPGATIYYYYSTDPTTAIAAAVNANLVNMISMSFGGAELDNSVLAYQPVYQQANAQGITLLASTGDSGAANFPDASSFSRFGPAVSWPASYPEVTAVGGTQFNEGTGNYWGATNASDFSSALSYIPEIAWSAGGGGASAIFSKPDWQVGPGVPQDQARDLPDISMAASCHDAFVIYYEGAQVNGVCGTSASAPSMAGVIALLNHSLVSAGQLSGPGLGNINPQLYRLAQSAPTAFHDITSGGNTVTCTQGSPGCSSGVIGYLAGPGYDLATGIGSLDVNNFVTQWSSATNAVSVAFSVSPAKGTLNDTFQLTATVSAANGSGTPTGAVDFSNGSTSLVSVQLGSGGGQPTASFSLPGYLLGGAGNFNLVAQYRGDAAFSPGGATASLQIALPTGVASIVPSVPVSVTATIDPAGLFWEFTMSLRERGGVAAVLTGINVDGQDQPVSQYFPTPSIPPNSSVASRSIIYRNLAYPLVRTFVFSGVDATGQSWSRQATITFLGPFNGTQAVILSAVPLVMQQNLTADPSCQWSQRLVLTEISGWAQTISGLSLGNVSLNDQIPAIFGTSQLAAYGSLEGTICWAVASPGTTDTVSLLFAAGLTQDIAVSFAGPAANPPQISVSPATLTLTATNANSPAQATLSVSVPDGQPWSIGISPQNLVSGWLSISETSGSGSAQVTVQASGSGFEPGAYHAELVIQGPDLSPAAITVPVMFVLGDSSKTTITSVTNAASGQSVAAPGMLAVLKGTALATSSAYYGNGVYVVTRLLGVLVTVNGVPAAVQSVSPSQINFQIPYETGTGTAVVGVSYNNSAAGYLIQVTPSAPAIYAVNGNVSPTATVQAGSTLTLTMTGDGVPTPSLPDGATPAASSSLAFKTALAFTLTIGGAPAFLTSYGIAAGSYGVTTMNVAIPPSAPTGPQPVVATVGGVSSPPVNVTITAPPPASK
jgi:uncharacterized protein (TIGR03437 family)